MLAATEEAAAIWRELADVRFDAFGLDLARSLHNLSGCLFHLERHEEAVEAIEESVAILRRMAPARPDTFLPNLARAFYNLESCLSHLGRNEEARKIDEEFRAICSGDSRKGRR